MYEYNRLDSDLTFVQKIKNLEKEYSIPDIVKLVKLSLNTNQ